MCLQRLYLQLYGDRPRICIIISSQSANLPATWSMSLHRSYRYYPSVRWRCSCRTASKVYHVCRGLTWSPTISMRLGSPEKIYISSQPVKIKMVATNATDGGSGWSCALLGTADRSSFAAKTSDTYVLARTSSVPRTNHRERALVLKVLHTLQSVA